MKDVVELTKVDATGVYDLSNEEYHGDCCAGPSLSTSGMKQLIADPADYWLGSPFNPDREVAERKTAFSVGECAHTMILEPELLQKTISVIPNRLLSSNGAISTKAAKAFRDDQIAAGRTVVTEEQWGAVCAMADSVLQNELLTRALSDGKPEVSLIHKNDETGVFVKSRPDFMPNKSGRFIVDVKTTALKSIEAWEKSAMADLRYDMQAAVMLWAAREVAGIEAVGVMYAVICKEPPYRSAVRIIRPETETGISLLSNGWLDVEKALRIFSECYETGVWPSPWDAATDIEPPEWHMRAVNKRLERGSYITPFNRVTL